MKLRFWGTRGDIPAPERDKLKYGGNTICLEISSEKTIAENSKIFVDAGIGLMIAGKQIPHDVNEFHLILTHYHWDHIQGILPFVPFFIPKNKIYIYGYAHSEVELKDYLNTLYLYVFSPLKTIDYYAAQVYFKPIRIGQEFQIKDINFKSFQLEHGDFTLGYKVSHNGKSLAIALDNEVRASSTINKRLTEIISGSNLLIHNCKYTDEDYKKNIYKGHSGLSNVIKLTREAGIKRLGLCHYNPNYTDSDIDKILIKAKKLAPELMIFGTKEGMVINL